MLYKKSNFGMKIREIKIALQKSNLGTKIRENRWDTKLEFWHEKCVESNDDEKRVRAPSILRSKRKQNKLLIDF